MKRLCTLFAVCAMLLGLSISSFAAEIKIGLMCPLTGKWASEGQDMQKIVSLLVEETNASGGINGNKIALVVEESKFSFSFPLLAILSIVGIPVLPSLAVVVNADFIRFDVVIKDFAGYIYSLLIPKEILRITYQ